MFQNIKADIIYYRTNTDFELEFNLCGCCRMRLLTDKSPDKKVLVHSLSRAVSRSRIIIISGMLYGDDGIISITSNAIGKNISQLNKDTYNINEPDTINIIEGSTPLVTPNGKFGGCIIESGPQSMILISDDKSIRKTIMESLIHPYIEELAALELKAKASAVSQNPDTNNDPCIINTDVLTPNEETVSPELESTPTIGNSNDVSTSEEDAVPPEYDLTPTLENNNQVTEPIETNDNEVKENSSSSEELDDNTTEEEPIPTDSASLPLSSYTTTAESVAKIDDVELGGGMIFETDDYRVKSDNTTDSKTETEPVTDSSTNNGTNNDFFSPVYSQESNYNRGYAINKSDPSLQKKSSALNITIMIISIFLLILIAILCYCMFYIPSKNGVSASAFFQETFRNLFG